MTLLPHHLLVPSYSSYPGKEAINQQISNGVVFVPLCVCVCVFFLVAVLYSLFYLHGIFSFFYFYGCIFSCKAVGRYNFNHTLILYFCFCFYCACEQMFECSRLRYSGAMCVSQKWKVFNT